MFLVVAMSVGAGLVSLGAFGLLDYFGILQYSPAFPIIVFGLAMMVLSLCGYAREKG